MCFRQDNGFWMAPEFDPKASTYKGVLVKEPTLYAEKPERKG
jgi:hypothetical protein